MPGTTPASPLARARSLLFVPGNRPERFAKALASGADALVLDLEDAVPASDKAAARQAIGAAWATLQAQPTPLVVRINALALPLGQQDLRWLAALPGRAAAIMLPKAESAAALQAVRAALPAWPILPLIESAAGWAALAHIAAAPGVLRLVLGHIDFQLDAGMECSAGEEELLPLRFAMTMHTRLNRLAAAVDGVTLDIAHEERLGQDTRRARRMGFGGKLCIHPKQVGPVHAAFAPGEQELAWARCVLAADAAAGGAAVQLDGRMVDAPVVLRARRVLGMAPGP